MPLIIFTSQNIAPIYNVASIKFLIIHPLFPVLCTLSLAQTIVRNLESSILVLASCVLRPVSVMLGSGSWVLGPGSWVLGPGSCICPAGLWVLSPGSSILGPMSLVADVLTCLHNHAMFDKCVFCIWALTLPRKSFYTYNESKR